MDDATVMTAQTVRREWLFEPLDANFNFVTRALVFLVKGRFRHILASERFEQSIQEDGSTSSRHGHGTQLMGEWAVSGVADWLTYISFKSSMRRQAWERLFEALNGWRLNEHWQVDLSLYKWVQCACQSIMVIVCLLRNCFIHSLNLSRLLREGWSGKQKGTSK